jgi:tetratricopeptide (TPR) repeat protein
VLAAQGDLGTALKLLERALSGYRAVGDRFEEATLAHLGDVHSGLGQHEEAQKSWRAALALYEEIGDEVSTGTIRQRLQL